MPRSAPAEAKRATTTAPLARRVLSELREERVDHWPTILRNLSLADVAGQLSFDPQKYTRTLLAADDEVELLLMGWLPGQASAVHDHGASSGAATPRSNGPRTCTACSTRRRASSSRCARTGRAWRAWHLRGVATSSR